jgi:hypothetical protein
MSTSVELQESRTWETPPAKALDEAAWNAWVAKGRARDRRDNATHVEAVKWVSIVALFAAAVLCSYFAPFDTTVRFVVAAGAIVVMLQAFRTRNYADAAVFGALALLYNPVAPVFSLSGGWQRAAMAASAVPFVASLAWQDVRTEGRVRT